MEIKSKSFTNEEQAECLKQLREFKEKCFDNNKIFQYLINKYKIWQDLLQQNRDTDVEQKYPEIVQNSLNYFTKIKSNYQDPLKNLNILLNGPQAEPINFNQEIIVEPTDQVQQINRQQQQQQIDYEGMNGYVKNNFGVFKQINKKNANFRVRSVPLVESKKQSQYEKSKLSLQNYVRENYSIIIGGKRPRKPRRTKLQMQEAKRQEQFNQSQNRNNMQNTNHLNVNSNSEEIFDNSNSNIIQNSQIDISYQQHQQSQLHGNNNQILNQSIQSNNILHSQNDNNLNGLKNGQFNGQQFNAQNIQNLDGSSVNGLNQNGQNGQIQNADKSNYELKNPLQTGNNMPIKKIQMSYVQQKTCFEDYLKQIHDFENSFELKVPEFFKDRDIHHYRMCMGNYQIGLLKIQDVIKVKEMVDKTKNQRFIAALFLMSRQTCNDILNRYEKIQKNLQKEIQTEKDLEMVKEATFTSYLQNVKNFEIKHRIQVPHFFKNKYDFMRREYYEKRFCLAVSDEDCIKMHEIYLKIGSQRIILQTFILSENQFQQIQQRAKDLLNPKQKDNKEQKKS